jgi:hypothetical protein
MHDLLTDIQVNAPLWKWILGGCVALGLALLRYAMGSDRPSQSWLRWGLGALRFIILATLCFLLLEPLMKSLTHEVEPSKIILVHDGTSSQWLGKDSTAKKLELQSWIKELPKFFNERGISTKSFVFGTQLQSISSVSNKEDSLKFDSPRTDIAGAIEGVRDLFSHKNIAAVIITTDGLSNRGHNPEFSSQFMNAPHFFVGSGDTTNIKDLKLVDLICNNVAYLGNDFPVEVRLHARGFKGENIKSTIYINGEKQEEVVWYSESEVDSKTHKFTIRANEVGALKIRVASRAENSDEDLMSNNSRTAIIDILESKRRVLIVADAPHPDVAAIKNAAQSNNHQEVEVIWATDLNQNEEMSKYDIMILHNLPNPQHPLPMAVGEAIAQDVPMLFIGGANVDWRQLPQERTGIIYETSDLSESVGSSVNDAFSLFSIDKTLETQLSYMPPLNSVLGEIEAKKSLHVLLYKKLASLETVWPLWAFNQDAAGRRSGVILGEGIWRWRMETFIKDESFVAFDNLINNSIKYLSSRDDVRRFRIESPNKLFEDERVKFIAQVYDASLNPTTEVDVELTLSDKDGKEFNFFFTTENNYYSLNCGRLSPGTYTWESHCVLDSEFKELKGEFNVVELKAEQTRSAADHGLLKRLSKKSGGLFLGTFAEADLTTVLDNIELRDIVHEYTERQELIRYDILVWLILGALTLEWIIRRRQGGY